MFSHYGKQSCQRTCKMAAGKFLHVCFWPPEVSASVCGFPGFAFWGVRKAESRYLRNVTLLYAGQTIKTRGLIDTGNHLRAPVSGIPIHVATAGLMKRLCPAIKGVMYVPLPLRRQQRHSSGCKGSMK